MSWHLSKEAAHRAASALELEHQRKARSGKHSSGHKYLRYGVRRTLFVLWEAFEHVPHQRPRAEE